MIDIEKLIEKIAVLDGSLRDIYIHNVALDDWDRLIAILKANYQLQCDEKMIPDSIRKIIPIQQERGFLLKIMIGEGVVAHCHFYVSEDEYDRIELDLDPRELQSTRAIERVLHLMRTLGDSLMKDVFLTAENSIEEIYLSYSPLKCEFFSYWDDDEK